MEIFIVKNGHIYARTSGEAGEYTLATADTLPEYPTEDAGRGYMWALDYVDGALAWVKTERPLTQSEQIEEMEEELEEAKPWKAGEHVLVGDRRFYSGVWYVCLQTHTTQADWTPDVTPALWKKEE